MSFKKTGDASSLGIVNQPQPTQQPKPEDDKAKVAKQAEDSVSNK